MRHLTYTLITGASAGLGREFAIHCAREGKHLILIALPGGLTDILAHNLTKLFGIDVQVFEFDLTDPVLLQQHLAHITSHYRINFLINNAGTGGTAAIQDTSPEKIDQILQLNIRSTVMITHQLIPHLLKHERSYIMNISSMAAFTPIAYKTVYPASKAFISSFSHGLREELQGTGLTISVVYPGPILTNSNTALRVIRQGLKGKMGLLPTATIARVALKKTLSGAPVIIPGAMNRINHLLMKLMPLNWKLRIVSRAVKKEIQYQAA
ncbi:SDR family NAD(P)-dependent oxidoreductase [Paraflavitalea pollutisoli]|uniref:SDR family NAD(P)-dependent oxidoreductase n=1 Tax=Paraflavitalea pollutisoli TaxID=3034143 RepID=UPI0023ECF5BB|nr:SDR family NAD(P)-dependent oxidoreductase [Paraflavitalea sp. H1-2-19X]